MALIFKDYSWHENSEQIFLKLGNKNILDVFHTDHYLKINFGNPKCILELFLYNKVDSYSTIRRLSTHNVIFVLKKKEKGIWNRLNADITSKEERRRMRLACLASNHNNESDRRQIEASEAKKRQQRLLQLAMDEEERRQEEIREKKERLSHNFFNENKEEEAKTNDYHSRFSSVLAAKVLEEREKLANLAESVETNTATTVTFKFSR